MMNRFTDEQIPVDILRMIINKSRKYSLIILVNGHSQAGKTTLIWYVANRIKQIKKGIKKSRATWKEWDAYNLTATNAYEFVDIWDRYDNEVLTLAESGESLNYLEWFSVMAKVFASTTRTQGLKRNICFLDTVMSTDIQKHNKENIDFRIWVAKRYDETRTCITKNGWVEIDYLKDRWRLRWLPSWIINYSQKQLAVAKEYTNWIATYKEKIAEKNKRLVGIVKNYDHSRPISDKNMPDWMKETLGVV